MMKKIFSIFVLALSILTFSQFFSENNVFAQDVWAYGTERYGSRIDYYIQTETITNAPEDVTVRIVTTINGNGWNSQKYLFEKGGSQHYYRFTGAGLEDLGYIYDSAFATSVVKALKPYLGKTC